MSLKDELIKLGERQPDLQNHIRPVLDRLDRKAQKKEAGRSVFQELVDRDALRELEQMAREQGDQQVKDMLLDIQMFFSKFFTLDGNEERAFNRLRNLLDGNPGNMANVRNQVSKIANLLDIDTPVSF